MAMRVFMHDEVGARSAGISGTEDVLMSKDGALTGAPTLNGVPLATAPVGGINLSPTSTPPTGYAATGTIVTRSLPFVLNVGSAPFATMANLASAYVGDFCYKFGGNTGAASVATSQSWNMRTRVATTIAGLPFGSEQAAAASDGGNYIYIAGGFNISGSTYQSQLFRYDIAGNVITTLGAMPAVRAKHCMVYYAGKLYVFGGQNGTPAFIGNTWIYDIVSDTWSALGAAIPTNRIFCRAAILGSKVYVTGGNTTLATVAPSALNECYDILTDSWTTKAPMPIAVTQHQAVGYGTLAHNCGGAINNAGAFRAVQYSQVYDSVSDSWFLDMPLQVPRASGGIGLYNNGSNIEIAVYCGFDQGMSTRQGTLDLGYMPTTPSYVIVKL